MSDKTFVEFWQHVDYFMAARMKIFGLLLMLSILISLLLLIVNRHHTGTAPIFIMAAALATNIADLVFVLNVNHLLNHLIQSWSLYGKWKVVKAFDMRKFMISSFVVVLIRVGCEKKPVNRNYQFLFIQ